MIVHEAEIKISNGSAVFKEIELAKVAEEVPAD